MADQELNEKEAAPESEQAEDTQGQMNRDPSKDQAGSGENAPKAESDSADTEGHYKRH